MVVEQGPKCCGNAFLAETLEPVSMLGGDLDGDFDDVHYAFGLLPFHESTA
jgi:hypothetical protein